ncbi:chromosomal replication initiator DnaA [Devosia rhodophyticola]|uniref:Chromosomal replication initiator DnaA n=1 Tax=Devosia rhodophyticola TaxID=3026423 RepID=A0ABY7YX02_9HYPH|nr:chromosomal replication initiator DnaA [Devosia rhodophyticola]WDR05779.1 chromosomal replication initiator DnaA [Devosia rhodophyticola]
MISSERPLVGSRGQMALELGHTPALAMSDFLVGDGNRLAYRRILDFPGWGDPFTVVVGPPKSGKSHLARIFADRSGAVPASPDELEGLARSGGDHPLVIEDIDSGKYEETSLFHLLNQSLRDQRPLLMTARSEVTKWPFQTNDVLSRARRAVVFNVSITDDIQLSQMLVKLFADRQVKVDPRIVGYVVARMERSTEEVAKLVDLMDRLALAEKSAITRGIAAAALERRQSERGESFRDIEGESDE